MRNTPIPLDMVAGTEHTTKFNGALVIQKYIDAYNVEVRFLDTGTVRLAEAGKIRSGSVKDPYLPSVVGIGYIGIGAYPTHVNRKATSAYTRWAHILKRCYNPKHPRYKDYGAKGVVVYHEWYNFQNFAEWYYSECERLGIDPENNDYQVDKDIGAIRGKIYCSQNCLLITAKENNPDNAKKLKEGKL